MKWNGKNYKPLLPQKIKFQEEKFDVEEYLKSLAEKHERMPVWRSVIAVNNETATIQPTPSITPSNTPTPSITASPTTTLTSTPTPTPSITASATPPPTATPTPSPTTAGFLPSDLANLSIWFDAATPSRMSLRTSGSTTYVEAWSGRTIQNAVTQASAALQPQLIPSLGLSGVTMSGGTWMSGSLSGYTRPSGVTYFVVAQITDVVSGVLFGYDSDNGAPIANFYDGNPQAEMRVPNTRADIGFPTGGKLPKILMVCSGSTSNGIGFSFNDIVQTPVNTFSFTAGATMTGFRMSSSTDPNPGIINEIIIYDRILTQAQQAQVISYLKTKWNYNSW